MHSGSSKRFLTMADDGMLINFDLGEGPFKAQQKYKGGSWKDRLSARKAAQYNRTRDVKRSAATGVNGTQVAERKEKPNADDFETSTAKRQRTDGADPRSRPVSGPNVTRGKTASGKPQEVISSLFSFNPQAKTKAENPSEDAAPAEPSNAPLSDGLANFVNLGLSTQLAEHLLQKMDIKAPTAIQRAAIAQLVNEDTDAFLQAETGSGKTLAYLLPIVQRLMSLSANSSAPEQGAIHRDSGLFAIVLAPTRELSKQISVVLESLLRCAHWIVSGTVLGGEKKKSEKARLRRGINILVATPGRLVDHLDNTEVLDVSNVRWLVLDEGDRLMELGFEQDIAKILAKLDARTGRKAPIPGLPTRRTTVLCSATIKMQVQKLGELSLKDAVHIQGSGEDKALKRDDTSKEEKFSAPAQLQQSYAIVPAKLRLVTLTAILKRAFARRGSVMRAIVFISCADSVDFHFEVFTRKLSKTDASDATDSTEKPEVTESAPTGAPATAFSTKDNPVRIFRLHGSLPQHARTSTLAAFRSSKEPAVMVCTDVAARGLDLPNVDFVIEYDPPFNKDDHLHRIGRTARAGKDGRALILLQPGAEEGYIDAVLKQGRHDDGRGLLRSDATDILRKGFGSPGLGAGADWEARATEWQLDVERWALEQPKALEMARRGFQSHVRAYATHVAPERAIFDMQALHLGHLAKAFALRDKPGSIKVPGLRPSAGASKGERRSAGKSGAKADHEIPGSVEIDEAKRKMRAAQKKIAGASEFNIG
ncbi:hypothetical protein FH972_022438 [Carpinus fangiana]|uniref:ATP-dependent RNA helicase n=1 Tax=Carpinus fangiana TaxID=176857 RepID=A0A5N6KSL0_9ROSI|nr:hypothetical protein FH972_022438 [Carpinus fangiana]